MQLCTVLYVVCYNERATHETTNYLLWDCIFFFQISLLFVANASSLTKNVAFAAPFSLLAGGSFPWYSVEKKTWRGGIPGKKASASIAENALTRLARFFQPRSQGSLLPAPWSESSHHGAGRREPWERGCASSAL